MNRCQGHHAVLYPGSTYSLQLEVEKYNCYQVCWLSLHKYMYIGKQLLQPIARPVLAQGYWCLLSLNDCKCWTLGWIQELEEKWKGTHLWARATWWSYHLLWMDAGRFAVNWMQVDGANLLNPQLPCKTNGDRVIEAEVDKCVSDVTYIRKKMEGCLWTTTSTCITRRCQG